MVLNTENKETNYPRVYLLSIILFCTLHYIPNHLRQKSKKNLETKIRNFSQAAEKRTLNREDIKSIQEEFDFGKSNKPYFKESTLKF
jgi:hypothetical protein